MNAIGKYFYNVDSYLELTNTIRFFLDKRTGAIYYSWLLIMASMKPTPTQTIEERAMCGTHTLGKFLYKNPTNRSLIFEIGSSRPDLVAPVDAQVPLGKQQAVNLQFDIYPQPNVGHATVYLYISDLSQYVVDCVELNLFYTK